MVMSVDASTSAAETAGSEALNEVPGRGSAMTPVPPEAAKLDVLLALYAPPTGALPQLFESEREKVSETIVLPTE